MALQVRGLIIPPETVAALRCVFWLTFVRNLCAMPGQNRVKRAQNGLNYRKQDQRLRLNQRIKWGLQIRQRRFDSDPSLHISDCFQKRLFDLAQFLAVVVRSVCVVASETSTNLVVR